MQQEQATHSTLENMAKNSLFFFSSSLRRLMVSLRLTLSFSGLKLGIAREFFPSNSFHNRRRRFSQLVYPRDMSHAARHDEVMQGWQLWNVQLRTVPCAFVFILDRVESRRPPDRAVSLVV